MAGFPERGLSAATAAVLFLPRAKERPFAACEIALHLPWAVVARHEDKRVVPHVVSREGGEDFSHSVVDYVPGDGAGAACKFG